MSSSLRYFVPYGTLIFKHLDYCGCNNYTVLLLTMVQAGSLKRFKPLFDRVLVERLAAETKTKGGVLIPEKAQAKVLEATVVAVGPGSKDKVSEVIALDLISSVYIYHKVSSNA